MPGRRSVQFAGGFPASARYGEFYQEEFPVVAGGTRFRPYNSAKNSRVEAAGSCAATMPEDTATPCAPSVRIADTSATVTPPMTMQGSGAIVAMSARSASGESTGASFAFEVVNRHGPTPA